MAADSADAKGKTKGGSTKGVLVELVLVTLIAVGAGAALSFLNPPAPDSASASAQGSASTEKTCVPLQSNLLDLPPIVTNLGAPADVWVRVEASIVFDPKSTQHPEVLAAEIAGDELAFLRTLSLAQLEGPIGLENVRQDLTDRASVRSGGKVSELVIRTLVLQ